MRDSQTEPPAALAYRLGLVGAMDRLLLTGGDVAALAGWTRPIFPLKGGQIVARGVAAGPLVAQMLHAIEACWVAEGFPDNARVMAMLDEALAAVLPD